METRSSIPTPREGESAAERAVFWPAMMRWLMVDRGVAFASAARLWQFGAGVVSLYFVACFFSPELQGFYYAFASLLSSQMFFDLGLGSVLTLVASHEWGNARRPGGPDSDLARRRLGELARHARRWYRWCALLFAGVLLPSGLVFFATESPVAFDWRGPWVAGVAVSAVNFLLIPSFAILEGCNRVAAVQCCRLASGVLGSLVVWTCVATGCGLWTIVASCAVRLAVESAVVVAGHASFFRSFDRSVLPNEPSLSWRRELLPLQWRIAAQNLVGYVAQQALGPIVFKYHGATLGGRMGMTWSAVTAIQSAAAAWIHTRVPQWGRLISEGGTVAARSLLRRALGVALAVHAAGGLALLALIAALQSHWPALGDRLLPPGTAVLLVAGACASLAAYGLGVFVRLHKIDPFLRQSVTCHALTGLLVWQLGAAFGPVGTAWGHLGVAVLVTLPWTWLIYRETVALARSAIMASSSNENSATAVRMSCSR